MSGPDSFVILMGLGWALGDWAGQFCEFGGPWTIGPDSFVNLVGPR